MLSRLTTIYPTFILERVWEQPLDFDQRLADLAVQDAELHKARKNDPRSLGDESNHFGHIRHNFLVEAGDEPEVQELIRMTHVALNQYLLQAYHVRFRGGIDMIAEPFVQHSGRGENVGIFTHTHYKSDFVVTYYPRVTYTTIPDNPLHRGPLRFYDPSGKGNRLWGNQNPDHFFGAWMQVIPQRGTMVVFEGTTAHDSGYFGGVERVCIPIQCDLVLPNAQQKVRT